MFLFSVNTIQWPLTIEFRTFCFQSNIVLWLNCVKHCIKTWAINDMFCVWCMVCWFYISSKPQKPEIRFVNLIKTEWWTLANKYQVTILDQTNLCWCFSNFIQTMLWMWYFLSQDTVTKVSVYQISKLYVLNITSKLHAIKRAWKSQYECLRFIFVIFNGNFTFT